MVTGLHFGEGRQPGVLNDDFRYSEVDAYFSQFKQGKFIETIRLPVLNCDIDVPIVQSVRGARYGFVKSRDPLNKFWIIGEGYQIYVYDDHHLFVSISDWHAIELERAKAIAP